MNFDAYLTSLQANLKRGSERTHYPALQKLLEDRATGIIAAIEEKGNCRGSQRNYANYARH